MDMTRVRVIKWIPAEEELPKKDGEYLVTMQYAEGNPFVVTECFIRDAKDFAPGEESRYEEYKGHFVMFDDEGEPIINCLENKITAWAELPRPF